MNIKVIIHKAAEGGYWAEVPSIKGCYTQAETHDELIKNVHEAIEGCLAIDVEEIEIDSNAEILEMAL